MAKSTKFSGIGKKVYLFSYMESCPSFMHGQNQKTGGI